MLAGVGRWTTHSSFFFFFFFLLLSSSFFFFLLLSSSFFFFFFFLLLSSSFFFFFLLLSSFFFLLLLSSSFFFFLLLPSSSFFFFFSASYSQIRRRRRGRLRRSLPWILFTNLWRVASAKPRHWRGRRSTMCAATPGALPQSKKTHGRVPKPFHCQPHHRTPHRRQFPIVFGNVSFCGAILRWVFSFFCFFNFFVFFVFVALFIYLLTDKVQPLSRHCVALQRPSGSVAALCRVESVGGGGLGMGRFRILWRVQLPRPKGIGKYRGRVLVVLCVSMFFLFCVFPWCFFFSVLFFQCASMATTVCSVYGVDWYELFEYYFQKH